MDVGKDLTINKYKLDQEWGQQAELYWKWARKLAHAKKVAFKKKEQLAFHKAKAKESVEKARATLSLDIRSDYKKYGFDKKPTEDGIASSILLSPEYDKAVNEADERVKAAQEALSKVIEEESLMEGMVIAMSHKKESLKNETFLFINGYFSEAIPDKVLKTVEDLDKKGKKGKPVIEELEDIKN